MRHIRLCILDVKRGVRDIEIAAQHRLPPTMRSLIAQLAHASEHSIEETELLVHLVRVIHIARMHVHAYDRDLVPFRGAHIGFNPATRIHILFESRQTVPLGDHRQCGQQADTGTAFDTADFIHGVQPGWVGDFAGIHVGIGDVVENRVDFRLRGANLLHAPHVRCMLARPMHNALAVRRAQAVDIRCRDHNAHGFEPSSAPLRAVMCTATSVFIVPVPVCVHPCRRCVYPCAHLYRSSVPPICTNWLRLRPSQRNQFVRKTTHLHKPATLTTIPT